MPGFPIRIFLDQSLLTAPQDFSQSSTSFIGIIRLGIHCVLLSTFLCIDLTSNWYVPITCRQSLLSYYQIVKKLAASFVENTSTRGPLPAPRLYSSFTMVPPSFACCKVISVVTFAINKTSYDLLLYHTSPEVRLNIRLTSNNYT